MEAEPSSCRSQSQRWLFGALSVGLALFVVWGKLDQGWIPHDEGQLGQAAERVLNGELPHRDFDEMYTGGLSLLNALSFHLFGVDSLSMRKMLFFWFVPFLAAMYGLFSALTKPAAAGLLTLLAATWSIPMYAAPMPSWYNLFFAAWTACALMRFISTGRRRWLFVAGLLVAGSVLFKISGLFLLAAVLLFVFFHRQKYRSEDGSCAFSVLATLLLGAAGMLGLVFVNRHDPVMQSIHFVIPFLALTGFVIHREWNVARGGFGDRVSDLAWDFVPLMTGFALPTLALAAWYYRLDAISDLVHGALIVPGKRISHATFAFPQVSSLVFSVPLILLLYSGMGKSETANRGQPNPGFLHPVQLAIGVAIAIAGGLWLTGFERGYSVTLMSFRNLVPLVVVGNLLLMKAMSSRLTPKREQQLFLLTAIPFFVSLVQYPYAAPIYFFYAAPLLIVAALIAVELQGPRFRPALGAVVVFLILFSLLRLHTPATIMRPSTAQHSSGRLETVRSRLLVDAIDADSVNRLQDIVARYSQTGDTVFATPDAPEVCFLFNRRPLNGVMYEFFRSGLYQDSDALRNELKTRRVDLVVINESPQFSPPVAPGFRTTALADFENISTIDWTNDGGLLTPRYRVYKRRSDSRAK